MREGGATATIDAAHRYRPQSLWRRWATATFAGETLGFAVPALVGTAAYAAGVPAAATGLAAAIAWAIGMSLGAYGKALPTSALAAAALAGGAAILLSIGTAQALVLRRHVERAGRWASANALAWLLGLPVPFAAMALVDEGDPPLLVACLGVASGLGMAAVVAAVTGVALVDLLHRTRPSRQAEEG